MFRSFSRKRVSPPELASSAQIESAASDAVSQVTEAIDSIDALRDVRREYVMSVFTAHTDDEYLQSANTLSETGKAYAHQVTALSELACTAALKLVELPDEPGSPYDQQLVAALSRRITAYEAGMRLVTQGNVFAELTGSSRLQDRYAYEYHMPTFEYAIQAHAQEQADLAARTAMPNSSVTDSTLHTVRRSLETSMNLEEIIATQEYAVALEAGIRTITE